MSDKLNLKTKIYLTIVFLTSIIMSFFVNTNYEIGTDTNLFDIFFFALLAAVAESLQVPYNGISVSTGFTVTSASILLFNPRVAIVVVITGTLFRITKINNKYVHLLNTPLYKVCFNISNLLISVIISSKVYEYFGGSYKITGELIPILMMIITFLIINYFLMYFLMHTLNNVNFLNLFIRNISMGLLNIVAMAPLGIIIAVVYNHYSYLGVVITFCPILLARYSFVMYLNMKKAYMDTVTALSLAIEAKDRYTEGHSTRVMNYSEKVARTMKFSESHIDNLKIASMLHDIGKIGIPESILNKPSKLSNEEYTTIKEHPVIGANIVKDVSALKNSVEIIKSHHERYDGKGYPSGLSGDQIPLDAYIVAAADAFDAMCSDRPYRKAMTVAQAASILEQEKGKQFHPAVVDVFLRILKSEGEI